MPIFWVSSNIRCERPCDYNIRTARSSVVVVLLLHSLVFVAQFYVEFKVHIFVLFTLFKILHIGLNAHTPVCPSISVNVILPRSNILKTLASVSLTQITKIHAERKLQQI